MFLAASRHLSHTVYSGVPKVVQQNGGKHYAITLRTCDKTTELRVYMNSYLLILGDVAVSLQNGRNSMRPIATDVAHSVVCVSVCCAHQQTVQNG